MKRTLTTTALALLLAVCLCTTAFAASFSDVSGDTLVPNSDQDAAINDLTSYGIINGYEDGTFKPNATMTRAEFAAVIYRLINNISPETVWPDSEGTFTDVPKDNWAYNYIEKVSAIGIINGYGNGKFEPNDTIKYEQAVKMVLMAVYEHEAVLNDVNSYGVGEYPYGYIAFAKNCDLTSIVPETANTEISRATVAELVWKTAYLA